ncbi:MAG: SDR family NAD(P)-dependent oxidoreductase [Tractidigestivibacter sp.]|uniref:SDR family NAD(P)-dependent oxidoreductase n=1 Tax=Tractidigestivibacter sp. TaxID=2847320 RepID=UPI003D8A2F4C
MGENEQVRQMPNPDDFAKMTLAQCQPLSDVLIGSLKDKVAIVTGGATGLGYNVVNRLAEAGAKVLIASRNEQRGQKAVDDFTALGYETSFCKTDVAKVADCYACVDFAVKTYGAVDILVTAGGVWDECAYLDVDEKTYDRVLDVDLKGTFFMGQAVARWMVANKHHGRIVFVSSAAHLGEGMRGVGMNTYYQAAKAGVVALTTGAAGELKQYGIHVNCVAPGGMVSRGAIFEGRENGGKYGPKYAEFKQERQKATPVPVAYNPDQVALAIYALCTPISDFMDGATVDVNGGALLNAQMMPLSYTVPGCIPGPSEQ